ncbi:MAG: hypothetical protein ABI307_04765 [Mycobacterium sp.]
MRPRGAAAADRYGPASFLAAVATMVVVEILIVVWLPYAWFVSLYSVGLASLLILPTGFFLTQGRGKVAQVGRGMLIGYLAAPLTIVIIAALIFVGNQVIHLLEHTSNRH